MQAKQLKQDLSNWVARAMPAYDMYRQPNFLTANGELVEGIYLDMPNDVYHALDALSSTGLKTFSECPAHYYRAYLSGITRKRTLAQKRTLDAGSYGHELCLEPDGFYDRYFREPIQSDYPDALTTVEQIETALTQSGLPAKEGKQDKLNRLLKAQPAQDVTVLKTIADIDEALTKAGLAKTESKLDKAKRLWDATKQYQIFDLLLENARENAGQKVVTKNDADEEVVTYGGKTPIDGMVWDDAMRVQKTVRAHREADLYLSNGLPEVAILARCPITGMMLKVKFDWLRFDDTAVDLKTSALSVKPEDFNRQMNKLHYDLQQVYYTYVASLADIHLSKFTFVAVEYGVADICQPYTLSHQRVLKANNRMHGALLEFKACKKSGRWYGYTKEDSTIELI